MARRKQQPPQGRGPGPPELARARRDFAQGRLGAVDVDEVLASLADRRGDRGLAAVAGLQHGLLNNDQLTELGVSRHAIRHRVQTGRMHRRYRGVYAVGVAELGAVGELFAATLASPDSLVTAGSALWRWGAIPHCPGDIHLVAPGNRPNRAGLVVHAAGTALPREDRCALERVPLTSPARALMDYAELAEIEDLERALNELRALRLLPTGDLDALRARTFGRRGWGRLGPLLASDAGEGFSRQEAERLLRALVRLAGLPAPGQNVSLFGWEVDFYWPAQGVVVEFDSWSFHGGRPAFERDRRKSVELQDQGLEVLRFTWRQLTRRREWVVARLAGALARRARGATTA